MCACIPYRHKQGFTLLELSIVLVVIAMIVGGVVIAQSMVRDAQMRGVIGELTRYTEALKNFQDKYYALPGDFAGAEALWGTAYGACPLGASDGTQTCNGNGNGRIGDQSTANGINEEFRAWQHLSNAGMVEGKFSGISGSTGYHERLVGTNIPKSQMEGAGWGLTAITVKDLSDIPALTDQVPYIAGDIPPNHVLWFGGDSDDASNNSNTQTEVLKVEEALNLDTKIDDGRPYSGKMVAQIRNLAPPAPSLCGGASTTSYTATYNMSLSGQIKCTILFKTGF